MVIAGSTISGNSTTANNSTGGVLAYQGSTTLTDTISAGNTDTGTGGSPDLFNTTANTPFTGTNNLIGVGDGTNFTGLTNGTNGNQTGTDRSTARPADRPPCQQRWPRADPRPAPPVHGDDTGTCGYTDGTGTAQTLTTDARGAPARRARPATSAATRRSPAPRRFVVTRAADDANDPNCNMVAIGGCTLRQAVNLSNSPSARPRTRSPLTRRPLPARRRLRSTRRTGN